jgi:hypothetical protein
MEAYVRKRRKTSSQTRHPKPGAAEEPITEPNAPTFALAHELWVEHLGSESEVSAATGISSTLLKTWRKQFGWDAERKSAGLSWGNAQTELRTHATLGAETFKYAPDRDHADQSTQRVSRAIEAAARINYVDRDVAYRRYALRFWRELMTYLETRDVAALQVLQPHIKPFTNLIAGSKWPTRK